MPRSSFYSLVAHLDSDDDVSYEENDSRTDDAAFRTPPPINRRRGSPPPINRRRGGRRTAGPTPPFPFGGAKYATFVALHQEHFQRSRPSVDVTELKELAHCFAHSPSACNEIHRKVNPQHGLALDEQIRVENNTFCLYPGAEECAEGCYLFEKVLSEESVGSELQAASASPTLIVDEREPKRGLRNPLDWACRRARISFESQSLAVGDYAWTYRHNNVDRFVPLIVERKTWMDLEASVTVEDGRLMRQIASMCEYFGEEGNLRVFIIEGRPSPRRKLSAKAAEALASMGLHSLNDLLNALQKRWNFHIFHTASTLESIVLIQRLTRWVQSRPTGWLASGPIVANVRRAELPTPADDARPLRTANHTWSELIDNSRPLPPRPPANERKALVIDRDVAGEANRRTKSLQKELDPLFATLLQTFAADEAAAIQTLRTALRNMEHTLNSGLAAFDREIRVQLGQGLHIQIRTGGGNGGNGSGNSGGLSGAVGDDDDDDGGGGGGGPTPPTAPSRKRSNARMTAATAYNSYTIDFDGRRTHPLAARRRLAGSMYTRIDKDVNLDEERELRRLENGAPEAAAAARPTIVLSSSDAANVVAAGASSAAPIAIDDDEMVTDDGEATDAGGFEEPEWLPLSGGPFTANLMDRSRQPPPHADYRNYDVRIAIDPATTPLVPCGRVKFNDELLPANGIICQLPEAWTGETRAVVLVLKLPKARVRASSFTISRAMYSVLADSPDHAEEPAVNDDDGDEMRPAAAASLADQEDAVDLTEDEQVGAAIAASLDTPLPPASEEEEEDQLRRAISASLNCG